MKTPLFFAGMLLCMASFAQSSYTLTSFSSAYEELSNPIPVEFTEDEGGHWDDSPFTVPFGFDFQLGDETFNSSTQFGSGAMMAFGDFMNPNFSSLSFFGLTDDIVDGSTIEGLDSSIISYQIVGNPGSRIAVVQYQNVAFYDEIDSPEPAAENRMDFQLWFYELNGIMEVHYGNSTIPNPELAFFGNMGPSAVLALNFNFDSEMLEYGAAIIGNPAAPSLTEFTVIPDEEFQMSLDGMPISGQVHRLTPASPNGVSVARVPEFSIYPTIAQNEIWVKAADQTNANYRILDITGKEVRKGVLQIGTSINVSNLNSGVYLISLDGMGNAAKFVKQ